MKIQPMWIFSVGPVSIKFLKVNALSDDLEVAVKLLNDYLDHTNPKGVDLAKSAPTIFKHFKQAD